MIFMEIHNEDIEWDKHQIHWGQWKTPEHMCFLCPLVPSLEWVGIFFKHTNAIRLFRKKLIWEWTAEYREQQCLRVIIISKIQKNPWVPKWRNWTHNCGLFPGAMKAALQFLLLTYHHHHLQSKICKECWMLSKERKGHTLPSPSSVTFLCHGSLVSLDLPPNHKDLHVLLPRP